MGFYINEKLKYSVLGKLEMKVNFVENMWTKIETNKKPLVLGVVYRHLSAAWRSGSERRFYDDQDRKVDGSPPNLVSLLRPWIRCFTMIISAWWNLASSKLKKSEENSNGKLGNKGNS